MSIDTRCKPQPHGFGNWLFTGPRGQQVVYAGWYTDAPSYLTANYGGGHWYLM